MIYTKVLLCLIVIAYLTTHAYALPPMLVDSNNLDWTGNDPGDPLDPSFVGETMDMPMDLNTINQAQAAGIITDWNAVTNSDTPYKVVSKPAVTYLDNTPPTEAGSYGYGSNVANVPNTVNVPNTANAVNAPEQTAQNANVTGPWSLDLIALDQVMKHLNLALVQNNDVITGYGTLNDDNGTHRIIASGSEEGGRLMLAVTPIDIKDLYNLDLSLDVRTTGTYTGYSASGATWSGDIAGSAPVGVLTSASDSANTQGDNGYTGSQARDVKNTATTAAIDKSGTIRLGKGVISPHSSVN